MTNIPLNAANIDRILNHLSPWITSDKDETYFLEDVVDYINNVKLVIARNNGVIPDFDDDWEIENICDYHQAMDYFNGNKPLPILADDEERLMVVLSERGPLQGNKEGIVNNEIRVYVSIFSDKSDSRLSYIVFYYFYPYQGKSFFPKFVPWPRKIPTSAHTADWEYIVIKIKNDDALNPLKYGLSQHGDIYWVKDPDKIKSHFPENPSDQLRKPFYTARHVHSIYDQAGKTKLKMPIFPYFSLSVDYHRAGNILLKGGKPILVYTKQSDLSEYVDVDTAKLLSWPSDWGFRVATSGYSTDDDDISAQKTAVSKLILSELR